MEPKFSLSVIKIKSLFLNVIASTFWSENTIRGFWRFGWIGLNIPTLLIRGGLSDVLTEEDKDYFLKVVSHAEFEEISNAAHMVAGDKNDIFSKAVEKFLVKNN